VVTGIPSFHHAVDRPAPTVRIHTINTRKVIMADRRLSRNDPCPCGSGKKYKQCCARRLSPGFIRESYSVRQPREVFGEGDVLRRNGLPSEPVQRSRMPAVRVGVDYEFDEAFGKAYVSYSFSVKRTILLESGDVIWVEFL
jgi:hypothetical protein